MEPSEEGERTLAEKVVHWRSIGLIGACVGGGLVLSTMVIGTASPIAGPLASAIAEVAVEAPVDSPSPISSEPSPSLVSESTDVAATPVDAVVDGTAAPGQPAPVAAPSAQSAIVPTAGVSLAPPAPVSPPPAAPAVVPASPPTAPAPIATTPTPAATVPAVSTTAAPATTTATPTTAAPTTASPSPVAGLTYPTYAVSGVANLSLQFDGSSIYVASLAPQPNWVYEIAKNGPRNIEIKFFNVATGNDREFHATVEGGRIKVET